MKRPIAFLGAGNIATALAVILARHKRPINLYCIESDVEAEINERHVNTKYLKGVALPKNIRAFADAADALRGADIVIIAVPSFAMADVMSLAAPMIERDAVIGCITKGLDPKTLRPIVSLAAERLPAQLKKRLCVIGGPAVAMELAIKKPAGLLIAGKDKPSVRRLAQILECDTLKVAVSDDFTGVGYAMAFKNIYAIALGLCDGLKYPMNTKALVMWLAMRELGEILNAALAKADTAASLAGFGDMLVTGFSSHGRNRTYGERLVGSSTKEPSKLGLLTVEGIAATAIGRKLARRLRVRAPLLQTVAKCLDANRGYERPFVDFLKRLRLS